MNSDLLGQRKEALHYNQEKVCVWTSFCEPLKSYLDVDWVIRTLFYLDSQDQALGYKSISTNIDYATVYMFRFMDNGRSFTQAIKEAPFGAYSYFLWPSGDDCILIQAICQEFTIPRGLVVYKRDKECIEGWSFGSKNSRGIPNIITQESVSPFLDFIRHFDTEQSSNHLLTLPPFVSYPQPFDMSYRKPHGQIENFKACINSNKFRLNVGERSISLSKREWECLSEMAQGKTYKGVANALSIGHRTVETYLNQIREKTGIPSKHKLIDYFLNSNQSPF